MKQLKSFCNSCFVSHNPKTWSRSTSRDQKMQCRSITGNLNSGVGEKISQSENLE